MMEEKAPTKASPRFTTGLAVAIVLAGFVVAGLVWSVRDRSKSEPEPTQGSAVAGISSVIVEAQVSESDLQLGDPDAPVTIIEYADFQCEHCRQWHQATFPLMQQQFVDVGVVRYIHRDFPLQQLHSESLVAARAARCAAEQDKFWEYASRLYDGAAFTSETLLQHAVAAELNTELWQDCMVAQRYHGAINEQSQEAIRIGVTGTPAFVINGRLYEGALTFEQLSELIALAMSS